MYLLLIRNNFLSTYNGANQLHYFVAQYFFYAARLKFLLLYIFGYLLLWSEEILVIVFIFLLKVNLILFYKQCYIYTAKLITRIIILQ